MTFYLRYRIVLGDLRLKAPPCDENKCIFCGTNNSIDLNNGPELQDDGFFHQKVRCTSCDRSWLDEYELIPLTSYSSIHRWRG